MKYDPIYSASKCYALNPRDENVVLSCSNKRIGELKNEWKSHSLGNLVSFSAFLMYKRIQALRETRSIGKIYPRFNYGVNVVHTDIVILRYGFITRRNRGLIYNSHVCYLYGIPIDEAILIQEDLLFELIDLDVYQYGDLYHLFYHDPRMKCSHLGDGEYLLHKYSVWKSHTKGVSFALPHDIKAVIRKKGWTDKDYAVKYPGYVPITIEDIEDSINVYLNKYKDNDVMEKMIQRRPHILTAIYPGKILCGRDLIYASRVMHMICRRKLHPKWRDRSNIDGYGVYPIRDISVIDTFYGDIKFWKRPETIYTLSFSQKRISGDIDIICTC